MKKIAAIIFVISAAALAAFWLFYPKTTEKEITVPNIPAQNITEQSNLRQQKTPAPKQALVLPADMNIDVPFMVQAPFADWQDPQQEAGCEEAAMLMAWHWLSGTTLDAATALQELKELNNYENANYGNSIDTSAADTAEIFKKYYRYDGAKVQVQYDFSIQDIITALGEGKIVLTPMNGQLLGNPYYKQPGPLNHMLLIRGYASNTKQFITNDPGTKHGQGYVYDYETVYNAIRDYPTGDHLPITGQRKAMIIITK